MLETIKSFFYKWKEGTTLDMWVWVRKVAAKYHIGANSQDKQGGGKQLRSARIRDDSTVLQFPVRLVISKL